MENDEVIESNLYCIVCGHKKVLEYSCTIANTDGSQEELSTLVCKKCPLEL